jgi:hypothetical protein
MLENLVVSYTSATSGINDPGLNINAVFAEGDRYRQIVRLVQQDYILIMLTK